MNNKEEKMENDLYGYEIPVRFGDVVIKPGEDNIMNLIKVVHIEKLGSDEMVLTFNTKKI